MEPAIEPDGRKGAHASGSSSAARFERLYTTHGAEALRFAYLITGDRNLAQDLAQEAFVRLLGRFADLRNEESFKPYLLRTILNLSHSHFRRLRIERREQPDPKPVIEITSGVETRLALLNALTRLPPRQRAALILRYCEDFSEVQTAEILRTSAKAVRSLVGRGLAQLREVEEVLR